MNYEVKHFPIKSRFEIDLGGKIAHADYHMSGNTMTIHHVYTPPEFRGQGLAAQVTKFALDFAREKNLKVVAQCPYAKDYVEKHGEYQELVVN